MTTDPGIIPRRDTPEWEPYLKNNSTLTTVNKNSKLEKSTIP